MSGSGKSITDVHRWLFLMHFFMQFPFESNVMYRNQRKWRIGTKKELNPLNVAFLGEENDHTQYSVARFIFYVSSFLLSLCSYYPRNIENGQSLKISCSHTNLSYN